MTGIFPKWVTRAATSISDYARQVIYPDWINAPASGAVLVPDSATHAHTAESPAPIQRLELVVASSAHTQTVEHVVVTPALIQFTLVFEMLVSEDDGDLVTLDDGTTYILAGGEALPYHGHSCADVVVTEQLRSAHGHTSDTVTLIEVVSDRYRYQPEQILTLRVLPVVWEYRIIGPEWSVTDASEDFEAAFVGADWSVSIEPGLAVAETTVPLTVTFVPDLLEVTVRNDPFTRTPLKATVLAPLMVAPVPRHWSVMVKDDPVTITHLAA